MRSRTHSWTNTLTKLGFTRKYRKNGKKSGFARPLRVEGLEDRRMLAVYTVDTTSDVTASDGFTTLREAVVAANANSGADSIVFSGVSGTIALTGGQINITDDLTITGPGAGSLTVDGGGTSRILHTASGDDLTISGLTLAHGSTTSGGGAIYNNANLTIDSVVFLENEAVTHGGAVYSAGGDVSINASSFNSNEAKGGVSRGGALDGVANSLVISDSTFWDNSATIGGNALRINTVSTASIKNSTFSGNHGSNGQGAIHVTSDANLEVINSTVALNDATSGTAGIYDDTVGTITLHNSIVAENTAGTSSTPDSNGGLDSASSYNLFSQSSVGGITGGTNGNIVNVADAGLTALGDYGGPTKTHALLYGSPAIDQGSDAIASGASLFYDQRGSLFARTFNILAVTNGGGGSTDIGAYELIAPTVPSGQVLYVDENAANSAVVGELDADDPDAGTTFQNWEIVGGDGTFTFNTNGELVVDDNDGLDFETTPSFVLNVRVSDGVYHSATQTVTVNVHDAIETNGDPIIISVNSPDDAVNASSTADGVVDVNLGTPQREITLRAAIQEANALGLPGRVTINLPADTYELDLTGTEGSGTAATATNDIDVLSNIKIVGAGVITTIIETNDIDQAAFGVVFDSGPGQLLVTGVALQHEPTGDDEEPASLPGGVDEYSPNAQGTVNPSGAPQIAEYNRTAGPNESITISGYKLSTQDNPEAGEILGSDTRVLVYGKNNDGQMAYLDATIQRITAEDLNNDDSSDYQVAMITLPAEMPAWSTYLIWVGNDEGWSNPIVVNQTEVWWVGPESVRAEQSTSIFGRNLAHDNLDSTETGGSSALNTRIFIEEDVAEPDAGQWITPTSVNPYKIDFDVPELDPGTYNIWVHNGHGGEYGWSQAATLTIEDPAIVKRPFDTGNAIYNITNDTVDDPPGTQALPGSLVELDPDNATPAENATRLQAIINYFDNIAGDETLFLPDETYQLGSQISWKDGVSLWGESKENTIIEFVAATTYDSVFNMTGEDRIGFRNLTIDASGSDLNRAILFASRHSQNGDPSKLVVDNLNLIAGPQLGIDFRFATDVSITSTSITGLGMKVSENGSQIFIDGVELLLMYNANNPLTIDGCEEVSVTNSWAKDFDSKDGNDWDWDSTDGWGVGRFIYVTSQDGMPENIYLGENDTYDLTVNPQMNQANEGEHILIEGGEAGNSRAVGYFHQVVTGNEIAFKVPGTHAAPAGEMRLIIVDGKGIGQSFAATLGDNLVELTPDLDGTRNFEFTPDSSWAVMPDASSTIALTTVPTNVVAYRNDFDFKDYAKTLTSLYHADPTKRRHYHKPLAAYGIAADDGSINFIADSNRTQESRVGMGISGGSSGVVGFDEEQFSMPAYWALATDNEFGVDLNRPDYDHGDVRTYAGIGVASGLADGGLQSLGIVVRDNIVRSADVVNFVYVADGEGVNGNPGTPDDPYNPDPDDPLDPDDPYDITIEHDGTGLVVAPFEALSDDYDSTLNHHGPTYVVFEHNDVVATKAFENAVHAVNSLTDTSSVPLEPNESGGRHYIADSYPEHLVFLGNTFDSGTASQSPRFDFNLRVDSDYYEDLLEAATSDGLPHAFWTGNDTSPVLPGDYQFHVLKDNIFKAAGSTYDPDFFYGNIDGVDILTPYNSKAISVESNGDRAFTMPILNPAAGAWPIDDVDIVFSGSPEVDWLEFTGDLNDLIVTDQGTVTRLPFAVSTTGLLGSNYTATITIDFDDLTGLPDLVWTIQLTIV
jgi:predicted outer membrane repeat protein